ncbi:SMEK domain-containing protein [Bradyrhizobium sp. 192]|uniref:SMEK domain-containing protein n=1 Tax=Bradyrhizobium sp. 192 TaxID=2782660 RepID=UPI001FFE94C9|nr:SMEK domain-containing protein [Bradyrhizobium sp. 192]UPJ58460.1 SMEK domain-containing protein [Bradyrhizobium sp. 192]
MNRARLLEDISHYLTHLRMSVEHLNGLNLQDINIHAETFFRDFLNLALGYQLKNINIVEKNARAIDLGDETGRIAIQVTSTSDLAKIKHTHNGFVASGLNGKYDRLVVLIIGEKKRYRETLVGNGGFSLSLTDDVWDVRELLRKIGDLSLGKLERCRDFLRDELAIAVPRQANEVGTLIRVIEVLSAAEGGQSASDNREDPDPEGKIRDRFADHAAFLERRYVDLHEIYGRALAEVNKYSDLGHVRVRKLQVYLMNWSDRVLTDCGGDPKAALDVLARKVLLMMGASEVPFDDGAIGYYLIDQLIACNIFPNKRAFDA